MKQALARPGALLGCVAYGVLVGVVGTVAHRYHLGGSRLGGFTFPLGIVAALAMVLLAGVMCRAWAGYVGLTGYGVGWIVMVQLMSMTGPGGDVLVPAQVIGYVWIYGGLALIAIVAFLSNSWFSEQPLSRRSNRKRPQLSINRQNPESVGKIGPQG